MSRILSFYVRPQFYTGCLKKGTLYLIFLFLQKKVEKLEMYISAYQAGLGARKRMTIGGLLIFGVILVTINAAFSVALVVHYKGHDERIDSKDVRIDSNDERIERIESK